MAEKIELSDLTKYVNVDDIQNRWMLVTAERNGVVNTLTASWGGFGSLWRRKVAFIFIRPSRYTNEFIESTNRFTLTFFDGRKEEMSYLGKTSGRDVPDKIEKAGLHTTDVEGNPTFKEGRLMISCRVIYKDPIEKEGFTDVKVDEECNPDGNRSIVYVGEIEAAWKL